MTDRANTLLPWAGVSDDDLRRLLELGRSRGTLTLDEVMSAIKSVDLDEDVILGVRELLAGNGIELVNIITTDGRRDHKSVHS